MQEMPETQVRSLGQNDPLEKEVATHSSILAWRIPQTEKPTVHGIPKSQTRLSMKALAPSWGAGQSNSGELWAPGFHYTF